MYIVRRNQTRPTQESLDSISQFLSPRQEKRANRKYRKSLKNESPTYAKAERHHERKVQNLRPITAKTEKQSTLLKYLDTFDQIFVQGPLS